MWIKNERKLHKSFAKNFGSFCKNICRKKDVEWHKELLQLVLMSPKQFNFINFIIKITCKEIQKSNTKVNWNQSLYNSINLEYS